MYSKVHQQQTQAMRMPIEYARFIQAFRYRMIKIAYLTRFYIVQNIARIGNINEVVNELNRMPEEFRQLGESITGKPVPDEVVDLLLKYVQRLQGLVDGMLSGDPAKADDSIKALYQLADEVASGLAEFNPYWSKEQLKGFLLDYFKYVVHEVIAVKNGDNNKALDVFEQMVYQSVNLGDYYAEGFLHMANVPLGGETISLGELNIAKDMKLLTTQLAYLTRLYMVAKITNIFDPSYIAQRLYTLPQTLHEKTKMILGFPNSQNLLSLLSLYIIKLESIVDAITSGDTAAIDGSINDLYRFSDQLADFLASINPYWSKEKWKELLYTFNNHLIDEATALQSEGTELTEAPEPSLPIFEKMLQAALDMGDYLAEGLTQYVTASEFPPGLTDLRLPPYMPFRREVLKMRAKNYDRDKAVAYAHQWAFGRNPQYYDFENLGGDCTNFTSQALYAGSGIMNPTPTFGWYYYSLNNRAPAWTGVEYLYRFLVNNSGVGPVAVETDISQMEPGDIVQISFDGRTFQHSPMIVSVEQPPSPSNILVAAHTYNSDYRPLDTYTYALLRFLHITHVNIW